MTSTEFRTAEYAAVDRDRFSLTRREVFLIFAFWLSLAMLTALNRRFDIRNGGFQLTFTSAPVVFAFIESFAWALITPIAFWLSRRFTFDRGARFKSIVVLLIVGVLVAWLLAWAMEGLRESLFPPPPDGGRRGGRGGFAPPIVLVTRLRAANNLLIYLAVVAAGLAGTH